MMGHLVNGSTELIKVVGKVGYGSGTGNSGNND